MKIAIIGASPGQLYLCKKAKEKGIETICLAWEKGAVCKDLVDRFYPISITEYDQLLKVCKEEKIDGVVSNASDKTTEQVAYIAEAMGLHCTKRSVIQATRDKTFSREISQHVEGLTPIRFYNYDGGTSKFLPCVVKPVPGAGKRGVSFVDTEEEFLSAIKYAEAEPHTAILVEEYIHGREVSVESISYEGKHYVIQITDKDTTGAPHFLELAHHQPSTLGADIKNKIKYAIPNLLTAVGFENGATHIELKIDKQGHIYLIEINARGGGDEISNQLVELSTGYDYVGAMIDVALGTFNEPVLPRNDYSGVYYLCQQTACFIPFFKSAFGKPWLVEHTMDFERTEYSLAARNRDRNGYLVYKSDHKIEVQENE